MQCGYTPAEIRQFCKLQDEGQSLMRAAMTQMNLSARAYHRILKLARTIADLAGSDEIQAVHLAEALQYCPKLMLGKPPKYSHILLRCLNGDTDIATM